MFIMGLAILLKCYKPMLIIIHFAIVSIQASTILINSDLPVKLISLKLNYFIISFSGFNLEFEWLKLLNFSIFLLAKIYNKPCNSN